MDKGQRQKLVDALSRLKTHAAQTEDADDARVAILALALAAEFVAAGKDVESHLRSLTRYVQEGFRW
jgi:hypothetical protein